MTIDRIDAARRAREDRPLGGFWYLRTETSGFFLDARTARRIAALLGRWWAPRWLAFRDLAGSEVRVRRADVRALIETTPTTRAADRWLERAREAEAEADRPPWLDGT